MELCLKTITPMLDTMKTLPANMRRAAAKGFINATDCAEDVYKRQVYYYYKPVPVFLHRFILPIFTRIFCYI